MSILYSGLLTGEIIIHTTENIATIDGVEKTQVRLFAEFVRHKIEKASSETESIKINKTSEPDLFDKLEKLGKLKEKGVLTEEEFKEQKAKL